MNKRYSKNAFFLFALFLLFNLQTNATTCTWKGGNGNWSDATKWSCGNVPNAETDVVIDSGIIKLDIDVTMASLKIAGLGTINGKANMTIKNDLFLVFGIIENEGNITVNGNLIWYWANFGGNGTVTINGTTQLMTKNTHNITGKLVILKGGGTWLEGEIVVYKGGELRIPIGQTLKEEGRTKMLYNYDLPANGIVAIEGTFLKSGSEDIDISSVMLKNSGNIEVTNGTLTINADFNNTGKIKVHGKEVSANTKTFGTPIVGDTAMARRLLIDAKELIPNYALMGALPRLEKAYHILKQTGDTLNTFFGEVLYFKAFCLVDIHFSMRRYDEGMNIADIIIEKYAPLFGLNSDLTARTYELRALTFYNTARLSEAIKALPKAIELRTKLSGELPTLKMRLRLAQAYARKGDFEKAIFYYTNLLNIEDKFKTNIRRSGVYNDLGIVYKNLGEYEKSLFYQNKGIEIDESFGPNYFRLIQGYENRGIATKHLGKYDEAIADFEHAYKIALFYWPEGTYPDFGNFYLNMADTYKSKGDYSKALAYYEKAIELYEKLIKPVKSQLSEDLIIVPDGILGYIPFEALLMQKPEKAIRFHDHAYLLRDHNISYSFSATLLREMMQKKHQTTPDKAIIAYAPFFDNDTTALAKTFADDIAMRRDLTPLSNSGEEAFRIAKSMGGEAIVGKAATTQMFVETAQSARILHLATHGKADDKSGDYAFLAFAPSSDSLEKGLLYVRDLYNLTFNADMVVLSACETGIGKLQRGEGIISLARAFAYAGAKSIVTSLWSVNDAKTKDLMLLFYQNLKKGKSKDAALRQAKLSFIAKNIHPNANPFFWAAFIGIGDMKAVR